MRLPPRVLAAGLLAGVASAAAGEPLGPEHFATGRAIELRDSAPVQTLLLDLAVYQGSVGPALADLRVFNARGEVVPHAIRALDGPGERREESVPVPLFRMPGRMPDGEQGAAGSRSEGLAGSHGVEVSLSDDGAIVRVEPVAGAARPAPAPGAWLLDLSRLPRAVVGLDLELGAEPAEFFVPLRVEASDDLVSFRRLASRAPLARLEQAGHRIEHRALRFPAARERYLLLSAERADHPELQAARARLAPTRAAPPLDAVRVPGAPIAEEPRAFVFDLGGDIPVERVQIVLPEPNTVVRAELFAGASAEGPWLRRHAGLLYRLAAPEAAEALRNAPLAVSGERQRWFKLVVAPEGGGLGGGVPALEASWPPEQLLFVPRGEPPFALGYGRAGVAEARFSAAELIATTGGDARDLPRESAALGPPRAVADPSVLEPSRPPIPPRTLALWAFLVLAVGAVLWLCLRLLRQLRDAP